MLEDCGRSRGMAMLLLLLLLQMIACLCLGPFSLAGSAEASPVSLDYTAHNNSALSDFLRWTAANNPGLAEVYSVGLSVQGQNLWAVDLCLPSPNASLPAYADCHADVSRPVVKFLANLQGDESVSREVLLHFVASVVQNATAGDTAVHSLLQQTRLLILPCVNPDGYELGTKRNANGVDLSRNFPSRFADASDPVLEPETRAVIRWHGSTWGSASAQMGAVLQFSAADSAAAPLSGSVFYPWASYSPGAAAPLSSPAPDDGWFQTAAATLATAGGRRSSSVLFPNGVANAASRLPTDGTVLDWSYDAADSLFLAVSLGRSSNAENAWLANLTARPTSFDPWFLSAMTESLVAFWTLSLAGIKARVVSQDSGLPISTASITVSGIDKNISCNVAGYCIRLLPPSALFLPPTPPSGDPPMIQVSFSAPGYCTAVVVASPAALANRAALGLHLVDMGDIPLEPLLLPPFPHDSGSGGMSAVDVAVGLLISLAVMLLLLGLFLCAFLAVRRYRYNQRLKLAAAGLNPETTVSRHRSNRRNRDRNSEFFLSEDDNVVVDDDLRLELTLHDDHL